MLGGAGGERGESGESGKAARAAKRRPRPYLNACAPARTTARTVAVVAMDAMRAALGQLKAWCALWPVPQLRERREGSEKDLRVLLLVKESWC